jgi:hypothetical protein
MDVSLPDLTQHLQLADFDPIFSGTYSSVHKGTLHGEMVGNNSISTAKTDFMTQVAIKAIRPLSVSLHTMRRVS